MREMTFDARDDFGGDMRWRHTERSRIFCRIPQTLRVGPSPSFRALGFVPEFAGIRRPTAQTKGLENDDLVFFEPSRALLQVVATYRAQPNFLEELGRSQ